MGLLVIKSPYVVKTEKEGSSVCYTVEGASVETGREIPSEVTQVYKVCWENDRITSLEFFGPKLRPQEDIIPEMLECMRSHDSREKYAMVLEKYCDPGIIRRAMGLLVIKNPSVTKVEKDGSIITYTVQGRHGRHLQRDTRRTPLQVYRVGWKGGRIISLEFLGPPALSLSEIPGVFRSSLSSAQDSLESSMLLRHFFQGDIHSRPAAGIQELLRAILVRANFVPAVRHNIGWRGLKQSVADGECWTAKISGFAGVFGLSFHGPRPGSRLG